MAPQKVTALAALFDADMPTCRPATTSSYDFNIFLHSAVIMKTYHEAESVLYTALLAT